MVYALVIRLGRLVFRLLGLRVTLDGDGNLPAEGPAVVAANHVSFLDFMLVGLVGHRRGRRIRFLCRHEVFDVWIVGWAMRRMGHIPVDRAVPAHAFLRARQALRDGEVIGVFPEAGVSRAFTVRALMPGAVALARETGAPLIPVTLWGGQRLLTARTKPDLTGGRAISIAVGPPWSIQGTDDVRRRTASLGATLQRMLDELQVRPEHQPAPGEAAGWHPEHLGGQAPSVTDSAPLSTLPGSAVQPDWLPGMVYSASDSHPE